ncbi:MAG: iron(III) transport system ATP-binding protein [Baekduia sp.]|jgi:iron(III) transport system ATP-binding protein|nr:iron(III) transport system ATP-binding protein [Baekduia sp.]
MTTLHIDGVAKAFGATRVLHDVDLHVAGGALTAVLGPSGCGKTTLLRLIAGFLPADAGTIALDGEVVSAPGRHVPAQRRRVGYVAQEGALFPHLDVAGNITFGLPRRARRAHARVNELLALVGLDGAVVRRYPHELSGGQQQRVALARALAPEPSMVLLDEPFASLDAGLRQDTGRAVAAALREVGATAVLVTHDQAEALSLAGEVAVMREGRIVQVDAPERVYGRPMDPDVAAFVGESVLLPAAFDGAVATCALGTLAVVDGAPPRGAASVLVRPEQIAIGTGDGVAAEVTEVSYFGHDAAVRLRLLDGGTRVVARVIGAGAPAPGDRVALAVRGSVVAYADRSAGR